MAYEFWVQSTGPPDQVARDMLADPTRWLRRHLPVLGDVKGRRVLHPLGSNGRKGIPLAILGAEVTIIDISEENRRYALDGGAGGRNRHRVHRRGLWRV